MNARATSAGAVAFVDIVGFTAFTERYGDRCAITIVDRLEAVTRAALPDTAHIVKLLGDGALVWFGHPGRAVPTMLTIVHDLAAGEHAIPARASVHYGHAVWRADDVVGRDVNVAVRMIDLARSGEVLCSATARAGTEPGGARFTTRGVPSLRGIARPIHVYAASPEPSRAGVGARVVVTNLPAMPR